MLLPARELSVAFNVVSTLLIFCGVVFALYAVIELGRSFSVMPEARRLVTNGPYGVIRHPVYLGEAIAIVGVTLQYLSGWALVLLVLQCIFQLERIKNEERVLAHAYTGTTLRAQPDSCRDFIETIVRRSHLVCQRVSRDFHKRF